jgi:hypothetical protein
MARDKFNNPAGVEFGTETDVRFLGSISTFPEDTIKNEHWDPSSNLSSDNSEQVVSFSGFIAGSTVDDDIFVGDTVASFSEVDEFNVTVIGSVPTGTNTVTFDLQKSAAGGAWATVLSAVLTLNSSTVIRVVNEAAIAAAGQNLTGKHAFKIVVNDTAGSGASPVDVGWSMKLKQRSVAP